MNIAVVKFDETQKRYHFACDIEDLQRGDQIEVETEYSKNRKATFIGYTDPEMVGFVPKKKVLRRVAKVNENVNVTAVRNSGRRTQKQIIEDARKLRQLLKDAHPTMLSTKQIADAMVWDLDSTPNYIKVSMSFEPKIIHVYRGWYTTKL